jgi:hypothetical protein
MNLAIKPSYRATGPEHAEHHRELAPLGEISRLRLRRGDGLRCGGSGASKLRYRCQHPSPMPEQDADVLEILIAQMAEIREINAVLGEALGILPQPEFLHHSAIGCIAAL